MKVVAQNRRAKFDYEIVETIEAGMMLTGPEVKSCRMGHVQLTGAYVSLLRGRPVLKNAKIAAYVKAPGIEHNPLRDRPLLMKQSEIDRLHTVLAEKGLTVIPLEVRAGKYIKIALGIARGRKKYDKRERIKDREVSRQLREGRDA